MLYFSYGSNMSLRRIRQRVPSARPVTVARLAGHELRFHKVGRDGSAKCDAAATGAESRFVIGVLFEVDEPEKRVLDRIEGLGNGYENRMVSVISPTGEWLEAATYCATRIDASLRPFHWYKVHVLRGAAEHRLPAAYREAIHAVESIPDPDPERHERELAIYR